MDLEQFYAKLPIPLQNVAVSLEGGRIRRTRYDSSFLRILAEYEARASWSADKVNDYRDRRVSEFVAHAALTVPYYRDLFRELGAAPGDFRTLDDVNRLPILTKAVVQDRPERFLSEALSRSRLMTTHTSGTTGAGLRFWVTPAAYREQWAAWWRYRRWHGIALHTPCLYFGGRSVVPLRQQRPPFWRHNWPGRQVLFSGYHLSQANARAYLAEMQRAGAQWIQGYPSLVSLMAGYALEMGMKPRVRWITLGAESLLPQQKDVIERAFGVCPFTHYGMSEGVANISQCPEGAFHVDEDYAAVEFLPVGDEAYSIVGTNFTNPAFPLIRYEVGDIATLRTGVCSCGRPGRLVADIDGRKEDYVITRSGARLGRLDHIFKDMVHIREAQIRQSRKGHMQILIVRGPRFGERDERLLRDETFKRVGNDVEFDLEYVDDIPRTRAGKLRFVVSTLEGEGPLSGSERTPPEPRA